MAKAQSRKAQSRKAQAKSAKRPLSRAQILQEAIALADESDLKALSMRKLAQRFGVEAMSLYNHVKNKDDLLDGMVEQVMAEIEFPGDSTIAPPANWKAAMRQRSQSAHEVLLRHPWATQVLISRVNVGPTMLRYINATLGYLVEAGFSLEMADHVWNTLDSYLYGFTLQELNFPFEPDTYSTVAADYIEQLPEKDYPYLNRLTHLVIAQKYDGLHEFELGLDILLNGLEMLKPEAD